MPLKKREPDIVDRVDRLFIATFFGGILFLFLILLSLRGPSPESLQERLRPTVHALLAYRNDHGRLPRRLEDLVPKYVSRVEDLWGDYEPGWDHSLKLESFMLGAGGRPRYVFYDSGRGWYTSQEGPATLFAPTEP